MRYTTFFFFCTGGGRGADVTTFVNRMGNRRDEALREFLPQNEELRWVCGCQFDDLDRKTDNSSRNSMRLVSLE